MNVWARVMKALQGSVNELGEMIVDSQAMRILDQEVRDAAEDLKKSKEHLASILGRQKVTIEHCAQLQDKIKEYEGYAIQALEKNDESLALEVAQKVAELEESLANDKALAESMANSARDLKIAIKQTEYSIRRIKQQADTVQASESVHRAQEAVAKRTGCKIETAMASLERIKERQAYSAARVQATAEIDQDDADTALETRLKAAGIVKAHPNAEDVLDRIKNAK